jgi:uncharacterized protein (TIGR02246 family)
MELAEVQEWVDRYVDAWRTNEPRQVGDLFAQDARYHTTPFRPAKEGRQAIVDWWLTEPDTAGTWDCSYRAVAVTGNTGVVTGWTTYASGEKYHNVYVIRFDADGRAAEFTEWWMLEPRKGEEPSAQDSS